MTSPVSTPLPQSEATPGLLPCPFCGSALLEDRAVWVACTSCDAAGPTTRRPKHGGPYWNTRSASAPTLRDALAELVEAAENEQQVRMTEGVGSGECIVARTRVLRALTAARTALTEAG